MKQEPKVRPQVSECFQSRLYGGAKILHMDAEHWDGHIVCGVGVKGVLLG